MEVNFSNHIYDIGPSLPQEYQELWAAFIDAKAVASIAPQSCVPHIPIKEKSETLTNLNGGNTQVSCDKHVTFITGKVIIHVNFLVVEDVKNPITGLDAIHHNRLQVHLHETKVHSSTTSAQSTSSLSPKSLLCVAVRFGPSRSCSKSSPSLVRPSVHDLKQSVSIQHHCGDRRQNHFRFKAMHQGSFNTQRSRKRTS